jgi:hypothetical protein
MAITELSKIGAPRASNTPANMPATAAQQTIADDLNEPLPAELKIAYC